jgi:sodium pump decarboxylase gamma subunit
MAEMMLKAFLRNEKKGYANMIIEGIKLSLVGILIVYLFLFLLVVVMHLSARLLRRYTQQEAQTQTFPKPRTAAYAQLEDSRLIAVIGAALAAHRKRIA